MISCPRSFFVNTLAGLLEGRKNVLIGTNAPAPTAAGLLALERSKGSMNLTIIGSDKYSALTDDLSELFDCATRGQFDAFFLGGGQIDGKANINLVGVGEYPKLKVRWPGSHGTPLLYMMIPNSILFREEHTRRALVPKVDFISAPGVSAPNVFRPGGPVALVTSMCVFRFDRKSERFTLASVHPGHTANDVKENTGFEYDLAPEVVTTALPNKETLQLLRGRVADEAAALFPQYAQALRQEADTALTAAV